MVLSAAVLLTSVLFCDRFFIITFDDPFAKATGANVELFNLLMAVSAAVTIVLAMNPVGSLLVSALAIFPSLSAMILFRSFKSVTICSAILSVSRSTSGMLVSILAGTPVGPAMAATDIVFRIVFYIVFCIIGAATGRSGN